MSKELISSYLSKLRDTPLLTKEQEIEIAKKLEKNDIDIIHRCALFPMFLKEILNTKHKVAENSEYLQKLSKRITNDSDSDDIEYMSNYLDDLYCSIENYLSSRTEFEQPNNEASLISDLIEFSFTNSTINGFIKPIRELYEKIRENDRITRKTFKALKVTNQQEYNSLVVNCVDKNYMKKLAVDLDITYNKLLQCLNDQEKIIDYYNEAKLTLSLRDEIKTLCIDLKKIEREVEMERYKLINSNLRLVVSRAKNFLNKGLEFDDLIQAGNIGLMKAVDKYEYQKGFRFSTYATWWIDQSIRRTISNKSQTIRIPVHVQDHISKVEKAMNLLQLESIFDPTVEQINEHCNLSKDKIEEVLKLIRQPISLETELTEDLQLKDLVASEDPMGDPYAHTLKSMLKSNIREVLGMLKLNHKDGVRLEKVLRLRFGIGECREHTLQEVGEYFDLTKERARQLETLALKLLKKPCRTFTEEDEE